MAKIFFTDRGIPLMVGDRVAVYTEKDRIDAGKIVSIYSDKVGIALDDNKTKISVSLKTGRILAELDKKRKFPNGAKRMSELKEAVTDYGGNIFKDYKVPGISTRVKTGDVIFIFNNRQAIAKEVYLIRAQSFERGAIMVLRDKSGIKYLFKDDFNKIIGIYNGKFGNVLDKIIPIKEIQPYLKDYARDLTKKIMGDSFVDPNMSEHAYNFLNTIRNHYRSLKIKKDDLSLLKSEKSSFVIQFNKSLPINTVKGVIHKMWKLYGNVCTMESNYDHYTVTVTKKPNTSDGELNRLIEYNTTHLT